MASFALSPEPVSGNSLTKYLRSITNSLGSSGASTFGTGQGTVQQGVQGLDSSLSYYTDILSGNKSAMEAATAPEKSDILSQYRARRRKLASGARGGGTNEAVASSEFSQAGDVASLLQKLRPQAAQGAASVSGKLADLGISESELGNQQLFQTLASILGERGQDVSQQESELSAATGFFSALF
jgi:hypothetical protein